MTNQKNKRSLDKEKLKNIILLILKLHGNKLYFKTKLVKLLYLLDLHFNKKFKHPLTNLQYKCYFYGPYSKEIEKVLNSLENENIIHIKEVFDFFSDKNYYVIELKELPVLNKLSEEEKKEISNFVKKYANKSLSEILEKVYNTPPFKRASFGETIRL